MFPIRNPSVNGKCVWWTHVDRHFKEWAGWFWIDKERVLDHPGQSYVVITPEAVHKVDDKVHCDWRITRWTCCSCLALVMAAFTPSCMSALGTGRCVPIRSHRTRQLRKRLSVCMCTRNKIRGSKEGQLLSVTYCYWGWIRLPLSWPWIS